MPRRYNKLIREGDYAAEVEVILSDSEADWAPCLSLADADKLDDVRVAVRDGDMKTACGLAKVYRLIPVSA